jgi:hypothetical protein
MYVHGDNLTQKEKHLSKYTDDEARRYLSEIRGEYEKWRDANTALKGPFTKTDAADDIVIEKKSVTL